MSSIPVFDKSQRSDCTFSRSDFVYDPEADAYTCPAGHQLRQRQKVYRTPGRLVDEDGLMHCRASKFDCDACELKPRCRPDASARKVPRSIHDSARQMPRDIRASDEGRTSRRQRKKVEMLLAYLKRILKLDWSGCEGRMGQGTSSTSRPLPRTSDSRPN